MTALCPNPQSQAAAAVLMIRPRHFASNPLTAPSNAFQRFEDAPAPSVAQARAAREFDGVIDALRAADVEVLLVQDTDHPVTPDAVFPNNWISTHADGRVVLYPMLAPNRREERRADIVEEHLPGAGFEIARVLDLSPHEREGRFLEGTGSLVFDHAAGVAYAARSPRTHPDALAALAAALDVAVVPFDTVDERGQPVYHTNVMMSVGTQFAVVCSEAIVEAADRAAVLGRLRASGREVIEISQRQIAGFAGNVLEVRSRGGRPLLALSRTAFEAFSPAQRERLAACATPVAAAIPTIEQCAGGSIRCMLAEIHLPRRRAAADPS